MAPQYVKPYVKRHKNDRADAEAICEAVQRPSMHFVAVKTEQQQSILVIHRVRETLVAQKTQLINALRAHLAEFGIVAPQGAGKVSQLTAVLADPEDIPGIGPVAATALAATVGDATVFGRDVIWGRGSAWCRPSTRAAARSVRAASPKRG
jgi:transposase